MTLAAFCAKSCLRQVSRISQNWSQLSNYWINIVHYSKNFFNGQIDSSSYTLKCFSGFGCLIYKAKSQMAPYFNALHQAWFNDF